VSAGSPCLRCVASVAALVVSMAAAEPSINAPLDAAALDRWWNFDDAAASEAKFRGELANLPAGSGARMELLTQLARAQGLQRRFADANATLDDVEATLPRMPARVSVRYLLERGRVFNSSHQPERAVPLFHAALDQAQAADEDFLAIDAAHMLGIAAPPSERLDWNLRAVAMTEKTQHARAKRWLASLYNNIGWTYHERGEYERALEYFRKALPAWEARGNPGAIRAAKWSIARALRSLGRNDEALSMQRALLAELERERAVDGFVFEELAELELARGDPVAARPWFAKAYAALAQDPGFRAGEPTRLERMRELAGVR